MVLIAAEAAPTVLISNVGAASAANVEMKKASINEAFFVLA